ncbi:MAG TPA: Ppx/GppA phosphatase family protein [Bryobacteraceae bacterium]|jgi:exopolyphosphatase/guanosine-5'-triphosphate,3'-diphosphate pyrophosphatase|nr:Ppx/GppA phosphatase family protein [Bryobacteraceae bacterium]
MPRYAAIDIGSNSVRMMAAEVRPGTTKILAQDRQVTRIGESVFREGRVSAEALNFLCVTLQRMAAVYEKLDVVGIRAVATSAVRDAGNQAEFLKRVTAALGTPVEIVSGQEEARLIHLGVEARWPRPKERRLIVDIGGGSGELIVSQNGELIDSTSRPLGAVRLTELFLTVDPPSEQALSRLDQYINEKLAAFVKRHGSEKFDRVVATSSTAAALVCAVNRIPRARRDTADRVRASTAQIRRFFEFLIKEDVNERRRWIGIGPRRAEIIVAGGAVFLRILQAIQHRSMYYSAAGVRDGIIADLAGRRVGRELSLLSREQRQVVEAMTKRYGVAIRHARQVASLAHSLFETMQPLHRQPPASGKLLEAAAYLHDIGHFISDTSHHKHSAYLVANSDLPGFTAKERLIVAAVCRFHRKSMPQARHSQFQALDAEAKRTVLYLSPLLRLADALDRSHEQKVRNVTVSFKNGSVSLQVEADVNADLEIWAASQASAAFREVYARPLSIQRAWQ